jgi:hypothetical protein
MASAGVGWLIFLSPLENRLSTYLKVLGFVAELSLCLWLLVKGVNVQRWKEQASARVRTGHPEVETDGSGGVARADRLAQPGQITHNSPDEAKH